MKVWIVEMGEKSEGGSILGVFSSEHKALTFTSKVEPHFGPWQLKDTNYWESGCDCLKITTYFVK